MIEAEMAVPGIVLCAVLILLAAGCCKLRREENNTKRKKRKKKKKKVEKGLCATARAWRRDAGLAGLAERGKETNGTVESDTVAKARRDVTRSDRCD